MWPVPAVMFEEEKDDIDLFVEIRGVKQQMKELDDKEKSFYSMKKAEKWSKHKRQALCITLAVI